jgi:hypothetical protein
MSYEIWRRKCRPTDAELKEDRQQELLHKNELEAKEKALDVIKEKLINQTYLTPEELKLLAKEAGLYF